MHTLKVADFCFLGLKLIHLSHGMSTLLTFKRGSRLGCVCSAAFHPLYPHVFLHPHHRTQGHNSFSLGKLFSVNANTPPDDRISGQMSILTVLVKNSPLNHYFLQIVSKYTYYTQNISHILFICLLLPTLSQLIKLSKCVYPVL